MRTLCLPLQVPGLGIESLGAALEGFGYTRRDFYTFPKTHLLAAWYAPPRELYGVLPRMFVSQLQANKLSPRAQAIIHSYADDALAAATAAASSGAVTAAGAGSDASRASGSGGSAMGPALSAWTAALTQALPWRTPSREDYLALLDESEYGAWCVCVSARVCVLSCACKGVCFVTSPTDRHVGA
jgi:hypothetical protein